MSSRERQAEASGKSAVSFEASASVAEGALKLRLRIRNGEPREIYVFDRLWALDAASNIVPDSQQIYRFLHDHTLRLLLGMAPLPRMKKTLFRNVPFVTRIDAGAAREREISIPVPIAEYSPYFKGEKAADYTGVTVDGIEVFLDYLRASPDLATVPSPIDPTALELDTPGIWSRATRLKSAQIPIRLHTLKRTDEFDRLYLPGENPDRR